MAAVTKEKKARKGDKTADLLAALGERTRLDILFLLEEGPQNVTAIARELKVEMVNVSHHLGILKDAGIIKSTRDGRMIIYELDETVYQDGKFDLGGVVVSVKH